MKDMFENVINHGEFELKDILDKIDEMYIKNKLTKDQKENLEEEARAKAKPENSYAEAMVLIDQLFERVAKLEVAVFPEEPVEPEDPENPEEPTEPVEEYPEYVQPTGAHDAYMTGDKVTFNDKKYICKMDNCVWDPVTYPSAWEEVTENSENE